MLGGFYTAQPRLDRGLSAAAPPGDASRCPRRVHQHVDADPIGIGKRCFFALHRAHPKALVNRKTTRLHDTFVKTPGFAAGVLKIQISIVDPVFGDAGKRAQEVGLLQTGGLKQRALGNRQSLHHGVDHVHVFTSFYAGCA